MTRRIAALAAATLLAVGGATVATSASAHDSFSVAVGVPGVAFGYSNGYTPYPYYAPAPAPYYYGPTYYAPPVVYGTYGTYYGPHYHHYYHHDYYHH